MSTNTELQALVVELEGAGIAAPAVSIGGEVRQALARLVVDDRHAYPIKVAGVWRRVDNTPGDVVDYMTALEDAERAPWLDCRMVEVRGHRLGVIGGRWECRTGGFWWQGGPCESTEDGWAQAIAAAELAERAGAMLDALA